MSTDTLARATENVLRVARLSPKAADDLRKASSSAPAGLLPGGGFHTATQIDSLSGLAGDYLWSEDRTAVRTATFTFDPTTVGSAGTYAIRTGTVVFEEGGFRSFPSGAGTSVALLFLEPTGGPQRVVVVAGAFIDSAGTVDIMLLADFSVAGQVIPRFSAVRLP